MQILNRWPLFVFTTALLLVSAACTSPPNETPIAPAETATTVDVPVESVTEEVEVPEVPVETVTEPEPSSNLDSENAAPSAATEKGEVDTGRYDDFEIITLLPQDAIPAIDNPTFHTADEADDYYEPDELVMGVVFDGDARAYSVPHLSSHEIVNDEVGGVKIAVTW